MMLQGMRGMATRLRSFMLALLAGMSPWLVAQPAKVVIITPHLDAIRNEFSRGFNSWHQKQFGSNAEVTWLVMGGSSDALRFVGSEFKNKPDGIGIDCFFGGGQEPFLTLADQKLLQSYTPSHEILDAIPQIVGGMEI